MEVKRRCIEERTRKERRWNYNRIYCFIIYKCHYIGKLNKKGKRKQRKDKCMGVLCKPSCKGMIEIVYKCIADIFHVSMIKALSL